MRVERLFVGLAVAAEDFSHLPHGLAPNRPLDPHLGPYARVVGDCADQSDREPGVAVAVVMIEKVRQQCSTIEQRPEPTVGYEQIEESVVIVVHPNRPMASAKVVHQAAFSDP